MASSRNSFNSQDHNHRMMSISSSSGCLSACFPEYGRGLVSTILTSFTVSFTLSLSVVLLDTLTYMAYCLTLGRDHLFQRAQDFSLIPFLGSLIVSTIAWTLFYSGACCLIFEEQNPTTKVVTGILLILNYFIDTAMEVLRNYSSEFDHSIDSIEDYLYAKLISLVIIVAAVSAYIHYYGVNRIHAPLVELYYAINTKLTNIFGVDCDQVCENISHCLYGNSSGYFALDGDRAESSRQNLIEDGGPATTVVNPMVNRD